MSESKIRSCPMPGCGNKMFWYGSVAGSTPQRTMSSLQCGRCAYELQDIDFTKERAIAAHNQLCEYVEAGKLVKKFLEKPPEYRGIHNESRLWNTAVQACLDFFKVESGE